MDVKSQEARRPVQVSGESALLNGTRLLNASPLRHDRVLVTYRTSNFQISRVEI